MAKGDDVPGEIFEDSGDGGGALMGDLLLCFFPGGNSDVGAGDVDAGSSLIIELDEFNEERTDEFFSFSPLGED